MPSVILGVIGSSVIDEGGSNSGDISLATVGSSPAAEGASLSGQVLTLQPADATRPGLLTAGTQTIAGAKTFNNPILSSPGLVSESNGLNPMGLKGGKADASDAVGCYSDTVQAYTAAGAKIHSFRNNTTEKAYVDKDGSVGAVGGAYNTGHLVLGGYHLWVSSGGKLYIKSGAPTTDTDGTIVGTQT